MSRLYINQLLINNINTGKVKSINKYKKITQIKKESG